MRGRSRHDHAQGLHGGGHRAGSEHGAAGAASRKGVALDPVKEGNDILGYDRDSEQISSGLPVKLLYVDDACGIGSDRLHDLQRVKLTRRQAFLLLIDTGV